mmetsp:Transcript_2625/g.5869  ORF Transcript_2625/g.5869 Transcript_2625/m.5869 type:complete len:234 (+) Transcript_2625:528-1229(+)
MASCTARTTTLLVSSSDVPSGVRTRTLATSSTEVTEKSTLTAIARVVAVKPRRALRLMAPTALAEKTSGRRRRRTASLAALRVIVSVMNSYRTANAGPWLVSARCTSTGTPGHSTCAAPGMEFVLFPEDCSRSLVENMPMASWESPPDSPRADATAAAAAWRMPSPAQVDKPSAVNHVLFSLSNTSTAPTTRCPGMSTCTSSTLSWYGPDSTGPTPMVTACATAPPISSALNR